MEKYALVFLMLSLFIVPAVLDLPSAYSPATAIQRDSVKVMHYNIHQGFNIDGYQDLESIARVIEKNGADIVSLNEVSRGWVVNGSADLYEWLADRLDMEYKLFMPASDLVWGNAVLSRYPLKTCKQRFSAPDGVRRCAAAIFFGGSRSKQHRAKKYIYGHHSPSPDCRPVRQEAGAGAGIAWRHQGFHADPGHR